MQQRFTLTEYIVAEGIDDETAYDFCEYVRDETDEENARLTPEEWDRIRDQFLDR